MMPELKSLSLMSLKVLGSEDADSPFTVHQYTQRNALGRKGLYGLLYRILVFCSRVQQSWIPFPETGGGALDDQISITQTVCF